MQKVEPETAQAPRTGGCTDNGSGPRWPRRPCIPQISRRIPMARRTPSSAAFPQVSVMVLDRLSVVWLMMFGFLFWLAMTLAHAPEVSAAPATVRTLGGAQQEGAGHRGPRAYHAMCARAPKLCMYDRQAGRKPGASAPRTLTDAEFQTLVDVNERLNADIFPATDTEVHGVSDFWEAGTYTGDCEDYMIAKKHALIAAGWDADQLLYAVVEGIETPYHAVLVVRTDRGDLVLDNLSDTIRRWDRSGYRFVIRQSAENPHRWVHVDDRAAPRLAATTSGLATR